MFISEMIIAVQACVALEIALLGSTVKWESKQGSRGNKGETVANGNIRINFTISKCMQN
jgi:surface antigen